VKRISGGLLRRLNEVLKGLEELEKLGCRVEASISLEIRLPELKAEAETDEKVHSRNPRVKPASGDCPIRSPNPHVAYGTSIDCLRALIAIAEGGMLHEAERLLEILRVESLRRVLIGISRLGRASARTLIKMGIPESTTYRALKRLRELGLISEAGLISPKRRGGPRTRVYALAGGG